MTPRPRNSAQQAIIESITRGLDNAMFLGAVKGWRRRADGRWVVIHRGRCEPGGTVYPEHEVRAFLDGVAAADIGGKYLDRVTRPVHLNPRDERMIDALVKAGKPPRGER